MQKISKAVPPANEMKVKASSSCIARKLLIVLYMKMFALP